MQSVFELSVAMLEEGIDFFHTQAAQNGKRYQLIVECYNRILFDMAMPNPTLHGYLITDNDNGNTTQYKPTA